MFFDPKYYGSFLKQAFFRENILQWSQLNHRIGKKGKLTVEWIYIFEGKVISQMLTDI